MKAQELRIGNFVSNPPLSEFRVIDYLDIRDFAEGRLIQPFEPIPLTEDWLKRFGFKKWGRDDMLRTISFERPELTIFPANSFCDFTGYGFMHYKPDVNGVAESARFKFQYVHQLQNLYFALTGTELKLN